MALGTPGTLVRGARRTKNAPERSGRALETLVGAVRVGKRSQTHQRIDFGAFWARRVEALMCVLDHSC